MPQVDTPLWVDVLLLAGVVAGAVTAVAKMWTGVVIPYLLRPIGVQIDAALDRVVEEHLEPIHAELKTNGGATLRDAVMRIERQQKTLADFSHTQFQAIISHLTLRDQADPALQALRERLQSAEDTGEMRAILRSELEGNGG